MYRCQQCNTVVGPREKMIRIVVETRVKTYQVYRVSKQRSRDGPPERERVATATGTETARELKVCASCARELAAQQVA